jgi:hypothetical protein
MAWVWVATINRKEARDGLRIPLLRRQRLRQLQQTGTIHG